MPSMGCGSAQPCCVFGRRNFASMKRALIALFGVAMVLAACGGNTGATNPSTGGAKVPTPPAASLTGAGATFPQPFYAAAFFAYNKKFSQVTVNYQAVGSGAGIQQLTKKTVDFGASDVPLKSSEADAMGGSDKVVQLAGTLGTESLAYNLQGVSDGQLKLTPGAIGYVELAYVLQTNMTQARLKNKDGSFVLPSAAGATAAAKQFASASPGQFSIVNAPGTDSAPISGYSWLMLYKDQGDKTKGTANDEFFYWSV